MTGSIPPPVPLAYEGQVVVPFIIRNFPPQTTFNKFPIPTIWIDPQNKQAYIQVAKPLGVADWVPIGGTPGELETITTPDMVVVVPTANNINFLNGTGMNITGSGSDITFNATDFVPNYTNVDHTVSPYTVLSSDEYISVDCSGGAVTLLFPDSPAAKQTWTIKDRTGSAATNNITLTTVSGAVNIDGATSYVIKINYAAVDLLANSTPTYEVF